MNRLRDCLRRTGRHRIKSDGWYVQETRKAGFLTRLPSVSNRWLGLLRILLLSILLAGAVLAPAAASPVARELTPAERERVFERTWSLVNDLYYDTRYNGVDWREVRTRYRSRVAAVKDTAEFYALMGEMVGELHDEHSRFLSPEAASLNSLFTGEMNALRGGFMVAPVTGGGGLVWRVAAGSAEEKAGLRRGDVITALNGSSDDLLYRLRGLTARVSETITFTVERYGEPSTALAVTYQPGGVRFPIAARRLPGTRIGYIDVPTFFGDDVGNEIRAAIRALESEGALEGLILDLRSNNGGSNAAANTTLRHFLRQREDEFRCFRWRGTPPPYACPDRPDTARPPWPDLPLAVLTNGHAESNGDVTPAILQYYDRALIVGEHTLGNTEMVNEYTLDDNGAKVRVAIAMAVLPDGRSIEGTGVQPDIPIWLGRWDLAQGHDPTLEQAVMALRGGRAWQRPRGAGIAN
ncbi:MAG: PDZ domain-containing protein [Anaerolineae bacterium]|nr:PDZ domain-containing protein [Anaerolineae bacterium]